MSAAYLMLTLIVGDPPYAQPHDLNTLQAAIGADGSEVPSRTAVLLPSVQSIPCKVTRPSVSFARQEEQQVCKSIKEQHPRASFQSRTTGDQNARPRQLAPIPLADVTA